MLGTDNYNAVSLACDKVAPKWQQSAEHLNISVNVVETRGQDIVWCPWTSY